MSTHLHTSIETAYLQTTVSNRWLPKLRLAGAIALPLLFYFIPVLMGYAWSAVGDPSHAYNVLDPPEGYAGRLPDSRITVEPWGTSVVAVPFRARLRDYVLQGQLPLWNPFQGLGQPFAAEGEGNPFNPIAIVRALVPYSLENYVTFAGYALAAVWLYGFLRGIGLSEVGAVFGGVAYTLSGALSLQIPRLNLGDQLVVLPAVFWAAALAVRKRTVWAYLLLVFMSAVHAVGGLLQIALPNLLLVGCFCIFYTRLVGAPGRRWMAHASMALGALALGNAMAAASLLPQVEGIHNLFGKNPELSAFSSIPYANVIMFFFPIIFGPFYVNWVPGSYPNVADWNNLFAYVGTGVLLLVVVGLRLTAGGSVLRRLYLFFAIAGVFLTLRFISFPPVSGLDLLPIIGRQSPKHANGAMALCFVVAAAITLDFIRAHPEIRVRGSIVLVFVVVASSVLTQIGQQGGLAGLNYRVAAVYVPATGLVVVFLLAVLFVARRWRGLTSRQAAILVGTATIGELSLYIPLGNISDLVLIARLAVCVLVAMVGLCLATRRGVLVTASICAVVGLYAAIIAVPSNGLPRQVALDRVPSFMSWLQNAEGKQFRSFGIWPEGSSIGHLQDIGAVGPLAPYAFESFVQVVADDNQARSYRGGLYFILAGYGDNLGMAQYRKSRPILDWIGLRYLVLDRALFNPNGRQDENPLLQDGILRLAYQDERVMLLESPSVSQKAVFATRVDVLPDQASVLEALKDNPESIDGPPKIEATESAAVAALRAQPTQSGTAVSMDTYDPNYVRMSLDAPAAGLLVLKDAFAPDWQAQLDGQPTEILRVNGFARGVVVPTSGGHVVEMSYRPESFTLGAWLGGLVLGLLIATGLYALIRRQTSVPVWSLAMGLALTLAFCVLTARGYFG